jgi:7-cyano-7-deazaguanine synthase
MLSEMTRPQTAVLLSAGLDSAVLAASEARTSLVHPIYVSAGLAWEDEERRALDALLKTPAFAGMKSAAQLTFTVRDLYPSSHWALTGAPPGFDTPDEDVYLAGRNIVLLSKAAIYCAQQRITRVAMGPLAGNPFPDATPEFFGTMGRALSLGLAQPLEIATPFASLHKEDVIKLGISLGVPFEYTLSCMNPQGGLHCGQCSKCRERRDAFHAAGADDPARYANKPLR